MTRAAPALLLRAALAAGALVALPAAARADVFEIGDDGAVRTRAGTAVMGWAETGAAPDSIGEDGIAAGAAGAPDIAPELPAAALTPVAAPAMPAAYQQMLLDAARRYAVSPSLLAALVWRESAWQPAAMSAKGAIGLAQLMPATARALAVDPRDAASNLDGAAHYLRNMLDLFDGDVERALAAYNAGPARVLRANGVPPIRETRSYVSTIIDRLAQPAAAAATSTTATATATATTGVLR